MERQKPPNRIEIDLEDLNVTNRLSEDRYKKQHLGLCPTCGGQYSLRAKSHSLLFLLAGILLLAIFFVVAVYYVRPAIFSPQTIAVPHEFSTIQAAIDAAEEGAVINIEPGSYYESLDFKGKNITLQIIGSGEVVINSEPVVSEELQSLFGEYLYDAEGNKVNVNILTGKIIGVYFSASWCGPCLQFTPVLVETYNELKKQNKAFEVVFVSSDRNQDEMEKYMKEYNMEWFSVGFRSAESENLKGKFEVRGIPYLVILDANGDVISTNGRAEVSNQKARAYDLWNK